VLKGSKVLLEVQVTLDQVEHLDQEDLQDTKVWLVKWDQKENLVLPEVLDLLDLEDARVMLEPQALEVDLEVLEQLVKMVFREPLGQLVQQVFEEKMAKPELQVLLVFLE